jgi:hypothetical protein
VSSSLSKLASQQKKLEVEESETEKELFVLQTQLNTAFNRLARLRRMKKLVKDKRSEAFRRGMQDLDEEDKVNAAAESRIEGDLSEMLSAPVDEFDWASLGLDPSLLGIETPSTPPVPAEGGS